jgi:hypothetical protein
MWYLQVKYLNKVDGAPVCFTVSFETYLEGKVAQLTPVDVVIQCLILIYQLRLTTDKVDYPYTITTTKTTIKTTKTN